MRDNPSEHGMTPQMIVVRFQRTFPLRIAEWLLAGVMISWGCILLGSPEIFSMYHTFDLMAAMAPQPAWGAWVGLTGFVRLVALIINGAWRASPHIRAFCAFASCFVWLQITFAFVGSGLPNLGLAIYPWFLALDTYNVFRASADARVSDDRARGVPAGG